MTAPAEDRYVKGRALARAAREGPLAGLLADRNITGLAYGRRVVDGVRTDEPAVVVYVARKIPPPFLPPTVLLPRRQYIGRDFVEVDVQETGPFYAQSFTARERPAPAGVSVGHISVTAGTLGSLVTDNTDSSLNIVSNNHVLANVNAGAVGDAIVQPGTADGGSAPADTIATLKRFVTLQATGNTVDCAIGQVINPADVVNQVKNGLIPVATADHPAVGLLFAGSCNRTLINPIDQVLARLGVAFLAGSGVTAGVDIGTNVEKVGRTTEYTTSTVTEIDVTATISYGPGVTYSFDGQIATANLSEGGDSGSLVYRGGVGGNKDACGCVTTTAISDILDRDLGRDKAAEKEFRQRYLLKTRVGRYVVEAYLANEDGITARARRASLSATDRQYLQQLYDRYAEDVRATLLQPENSTATLGAAQLDAARRALERFRPYLSASTAEAAEELLRLADAWEGLTLTEILQRLDDEDLLNRVRRVVERILPG